MREDELRALVRNDPAGFRQYVGFLKEQRERKLRAAHIAGRFGFVTNCVAVLSIGFLCAVLISGGPVSWEESSVVRVAFCILVPSVCASAVAELTAYIIERRVRHIVSEIDLAESIASATLAAGTPT